MWNPKKSSLLQVFVSIQSMILIDLPYFNEYVCPPISPSPPPLSPPNYLLTFSIRRPGFGKANAADKSSQAYNKSVSLQTMRWAIVEWLKNEHKDGIWGVSIFLYLLILFYFVRLMRVWSTGRHRIPLHNPRTQDPRTVCQNFHFYSTPSI